MPPSYQPRRLTAPPPLPDPPPPPCRLDYANFCLTACLIVAAAVVSAVAEPHVTPYYVWDARIANPLHSELDTIPSWRVLRGAWARLCPSALPTCRRFALLKACV